MAPGVIITNAWNEQEQHGWISSTDCSALHNSCPRNVQHLVSAVANEPARRDRAVDWAWRPVTWSVDRRRYCQLSRGNFVDTWISLTCIVGLVERSLHAKNSSILTECSYKWHCVYLEAGLKRSTTTTRVGLGTITVFDVYKWFGLTHSQCSLKICRWYKDL